MNESNMSHDTSLARYTSWRVGGPASSLYKPSGVLEWQYFLKSLPPKEPILCLGLGSNVLIRDGGFAGTVVITQGGLKQIERIDTLLVKAEAGVSCASLARFCARAGLEGAEFLAGIPGTFGGALRMNAGCFGGETWDVVASVETLDRQGQLHQRLPSDYDIAYRHVSGPHEEWFTSGILQLKLGDRLESLACIKQLLERRRDTQPTSDFTCGSVFRNPDHTYAAQLIERSGLKGKGIGGAMVSPKHANFIVNTGTATAKDIESLIEYVHNTVFDKTNVLLKKEVIIEGCHEVCV